MKSNFSVCACVYVRQRERDKELSARGGRNMLGTLEQSGVVGAHLERGFTWDVWGTASSRPGVRVKELSRVIGAVTETRAVVIWMRPVELLCCVSLHKQVNRHHACCLQKRGKSGWVNSVRNLMKPRTECYLSEQEGDSREGERPAVLVAEVGFVGLSSVQHFITDVGDIQHQTNY